MTKVKVKPFETVQLFDFKVQKEEVPPGCLAVLKGYATLSDDKTNKNKHFYPKGFWKSILEGNEAIQEKIATKTFFGSFRHPEKGESPIPDFENSSHNIRDFHIDDKGVFVTLDVFDNEQGRALKPLLDYGSKLGISTRAYGDVAINDEGYKVPVKGKYLFVTWDLVSYPAFSETRMTQVSDSATIELDEGIFNAKSKDEILKSVKSLSRSDAENICLYMGYDFDVIADSFSEEKLDSEEALDQALDVIKRLEKENEELRNGGTDSTIKGLNAKIESLNLEIDSLKTDRVTGNLSDSVLLLKERVKKANSVIDSLKQGNDMLKGILSDKNTIIQGLNTQVIELNDEITNIKKSNKTLQLINNELENKLTTATKPTNDSALHQPPSTARKVKNAGPLFRMYTGENKSQQVSDDAGDLKAIFTKLR